MSIKDYSFQVRIKKRGRPTNWEVEISKIISDIMNRPKTKKSMLDKRSELMAFGTTSPLTEEEIEQTRNKK